MTDYCTELGRTSTGTEFELEADAAAWLDLHKWGVIAVLCCAVQEKEESEVAVAIGTDKGQGAVMRWTAHVSEWRSPAIT